MSLRRNRVLAAIAAGAAVALAALIWPGGGGSASPGLVTQSLSGALTAQDLANDLAGAGVTVSNVTYAGADVAAGRFNGGTGIIGFESGIILSSGDIANVTGPNIQDSITGANGLPGDSDLDSLVPGYTTFDAAVLQFDFVPSSDVVSFVYVFGSDEYNEYVGVNDVFGFFVNGVNYALIPPVTGIPVSINNVNCGSPFVGAGPNCESYRNNDPDDPGPPTIDTELDGLTIVLGFQAPVNPGVTNHIKLAIADAADSILDSDVFVKAGSFVPEPLPTHTATPTETATPTPTGAATATATATHTPTAGATATATPTLAPTAGATATATPTLSPTAAASPPATATSTPTAAASAIAPATFTPTVTATSTVTPTATLAPTMSPSPTPTSTPTPAPTLTPTRTSTPILARTSTPTGTVGAAPTRTATPAGLPALLGPPPPPSASGPELRPPLGPALNPPGPRPFSVLGRATATPTRARHAETATATRTRTPSPTPTPRSTPASEVVGLVRPPPEPPVRSSQVLGASTEAGGRVRPSVIASVPGPDELSTDADVVATNSLMAMIVLVVILLTSTLFNQTMKENQEEIEEFAGRFLAPFRRLFGLVGQGWGAVSVGRPRTEAMAGPAAVLVLTALVYSFLERGIGFNQKSLVIFSSLFLGMGAVTYVCEGGQALFTRRQLGVPARVRLYPVALLIAVVSVMLSRLTDFQPGLVYGFVASYALLVPASFDRRETGQIVFVPALALLTISVIAWVLVIPLREVSESRNDWWAALSEGGAVAIFVGGVEGLFFNMVPLTFMDGAKIWQWNRAVWLLFTGAVSFLFWHVLLNQEKAYSSALREAKVTAALALLATCMVITLGMWLFFRVRAHKPGLGIELDREKMKKYEAEV